MGFPHTLVGKECVCNAGDPGSIPGLGRSPGEGIGYPLQCSWAFLVVQLVKTPPAMWETWVRLLDWEGYPGEGKGYPLQYSGLENSIDHGVAKSRTQLSDFQFEEIVNYFSSSHMIEALELLECIFVLLIVIIPNKSKAMNFSNDIKKNQIYSHMYYVSWGNLFFLFVVL